MLTDIILLYILYTIKAPAWFYALVGFRLSVSLMQLGTIIKKTK